MRIHLLNKKRCREDFQTSFSEACYFFYLRKHMPFIICLFLIAVKFTVIPVSAQETGDVILEKSTEEFVFTTGSKDHPVVIRHNIRNKYSSNTLAFFNVAETYNSNIEINSVEYVFNDKKQKDFKPKHTYYDIDGIFYSDEKICHFEILFLEKGQSAEVSFKKTILDPRYFSTIYFTENCFTKKKVISIVVPTWMQIEIREYNFKDAGIIQSSKSEGNNTIYTYELSNRPPYTHVSDAPGISYTDPHLVIWCKRAVLEDQLVAYFTTIKDQYLWYQQLLERPIDDEAILRQKVTFITKNHFPSLEAVKSVFSWVRDSIRYLAFEDGIAGFKPEKPTEVLRKRYGDCKGMAYLLTELLRSAGYDARMSWLGTNHIVYDHSFPSLCVDNHAICTLFIEGKIYYLDATEKYLGFDEISERIQDREIMIEHNDEFLLRKIPNKTPAQNTLLESKTVRIDKTNLVGMCTANWKGESKQRLLGGINEVKKDDQKKTLYNNLTRNNSQVELRNINITPVEEYNKDFRVEYDFTFKNAVFVSGKERYIDIDWRKEFSNMTIDNNRTMPYLFPYKSRILVEIIMELPKNVTILSIPAPLKIESPEYSFYGSYTLEKDKINYRKEINIHITRLEPEKIADWNKCIQQLNEFYGSQLALTVN